MKASIGNSYLSDSSFNFKVWRETLASFNMLVIA